MRDRIGALFLIVVLVWIVQQYPYSGLSGTPNANAYLLGFVILTGYLAGEILLLAQLPRLTGYLLTGILFGPHCLGMVTQEAVQDFLPINQIALTLIALTAGGELRLSLLRRCWKILVCILFSQTFLIFLLGSMSTYLLIRTIPFFPGTDAPVQWGIAMVVGAIAISQSPATTIALITETRAAGLCTELSLGVTVAIDIVVIVLFTVLLMALGLMDRSAEALEWGKLGNLGVELLFSIGTGILAGILLSFYLTRVRSNPILFLLAFCYLVSVGANAVHLDALLVSVTAGIWVTNASHAGEELIETIEEGSLIVYVIFFCVAGALLDLESLSRMWPLALILVGLRMGFVALSTWFGVRLARASISSLPTFWMVYLPQAGVSLGLVVLLEREGLSWVVPVKTLLVACIAINQIIGPILMKYALIRSGEAGQHKRSSR